MARSYYKDAAGGVGTQTLGVWKGYVGFLFAHRVLTDADGHKLTRAPDYTSYFTNAYMPRRELMRARVLAVLPPLADRRRCWSRSGSSTRTSAGSATTCCPRRAGCSPSPGTTAATSGQHAADAARDAARLRAVARGRRSSWPSSSTPRAVLAARAHARAHHDADAADRGDRAADGPLVRLRPDAQGAARRARDVLPAHGRPRRGLRRERAGSRGAAALDGREPCARLPLGTLPDRRCRSSSPASASRSPTPWSPRSSRSTPAPSEGLGIYMQNAKNSFRTDLVLAAVLVQRLLTLCALRAHLRARAHRDPVVPAVPPSGRER